MAEARLRLAGGRHGRRPTGCGKRCSTSSSTASIGRATRRRCPTCLPVPAPMGWKRASRGAAGATFIDPGGGGAARHPPKRRQPRRPGRATLLQLDATAAAAAVRRRRAVRHRLPRSALWLGGRVSGARRPRRPRLAGRRRPRRPVVEVELYDRSPSAFAVVDDRGWAPYASSSTASAWATDQSVRPSVGEDELAALDAEAAEPAEKDMPRSDRPRIRC